MEAFALQEFEIGDRWYLLLPKLNEAQTGAMAKRLEQKGYTIGSSRVMVARKGSQTIRVSPVGVCWSSSDPADVVGPLLPELLAMPKEKTALELLSELYFTLERRGESTTLRLVTRMESGSTWRALRSMGECALTPDEWAVATLLFGKSSEEVPLVTDFPNSGARTRVIGRRQYYESMLSATEAAATLRTGKEAQRNSYLPSTGLVVTGKVKVTRETLLRVFRGTGEWCYFAAG